MSIKTAMDVKMDDATAAQATVHQVVSLAVLATTAAVVGVGWTAFKEVAHRRNMAHMREIRELENES